MWLVCMSVSARVTRSTVARGRLLRKQEGSRRPPAVQTLTDPRAVRCHTLSLLRGGGDKAGCCMNYAMLLTDVYVGIASAYSNGSPVALKVRRDVKMLIFLPNYSYISSI